MSNDKLKISVLVPIYGTEKFIERCARSIFEQTWENIEAIFVDDCTPDKSIDILRNVVNDYPKRKEYVRIVCHECNKGLAVARRTGIESSTGQYILHVDSDDWLEPHAVERLLSVAVKEDADIVNFGYFAEYAQKTIMSKVCCDKVKLINDILTNKTHAAIWSKLYKTSFIKQSGIDIVEGLNQGEDYVMVPRLLHKASKIVTISDCLYHYELANQGSYTKNVKASAIKNIREADDILNTYFGAVSDRNNYEESLRNLYVRSMLYLIKTSSYKNYNKILEEYNNVNLKAKFIGLSVSDNIIISLLKYKLYWPCFILIQFFSRIR